MSTGSSSSPPSSSPGSLSRIIATVSFLKQIDLFREVPADYLVAVAHLAEERSCWAGERLFAEGEPGDCLYLIIAGEIRVQAHGVDVALLSAGEVVGEMAVLDSHPRSATALVEKDGKVLRIGSDDFRLLLLSHPEMSMALLRTLARRLRAAPSDAPFLDALEDGRLGEGLPSVPSTGAAEMLRTFAPALEDLLPTMPAGTLLADRFRLGEPLGTTRYAAEDVRLGEAVIVQLVPPAMTRDAATLEQLRKRVAAARRFSHRNVQRAFDLIVDGVAALVTLEHATGPSLATRIADAGVIPAAEGWALAAQLAAGLAALEEAGLPLPTLTPSSIVLVPASASLETTRKWRLVLPAIDFRESDRGADLPAFGRLVVEMLSDRRDSTSTEGLDPRAAALVKRCFGLGGEARITSFAQLDEAFSGEVRISPARRAAAAVALALLALGIGIAGGRLIRPTPPAAVAAAGAPELDPGRRAVAVLGLVQAGGTSESAWIGTALVEMLVSELGAGGRVRVVTPELVARARTELSVPPGGEPAPALLGSLRARLGADLFVSGTFAPAAGDVRLELRLLEAGSGRVVAKVGEVAPEGKLFELAARLGARLRYELRLGDVSARQASEVRAALPENAAAARLYAEGLERMRTLDAADARALFSKAVESDPFHAPARAALARAHSALGYDRLAREEARKAHDLSLDLPRETQLAIEARFRELGGERGRAAELYRKLVAAAPDDPEPALSLASVLVADGKGKEALSVLTSLRRTKAGAADPRVDLAEAEASLGDLARQLAAARRAAERGRAAGALQLVARARLQEANALLVSKSAPAAREALLDSKRLFESAGDRAGVALALTRLAGVAIDSQDGGEATRRIRDAIDIFREIEDQRGIVESLVAYSWALRASGEAAASRKVARQAKGIAEELGDARLRITSANALASAHMLAGDESGALTVYREALALARETGDEAKQVTLLNNIASILLVRNDPEAVTLYEEGIALARRTGERRMLPMSLVNLSIIQARLGQLEPARAANEEAVRICRATGNQRALAYALTALADIDVTRGETVASRKLFEEAKSLHRQLGDEAEATVVDFYLEKVDRAEEQFEAALARATRTAEWAASHGNPLVEGYALLSKAKILAELGRHREVLAAVARTKAVGRPFPELLQASRVDEARARGALGGTAARRKAIVELEAVAKAARGRDLGLVFDAILAAAELETERGRRLERIDAVVAEAKPLGFEIVVRTAEKLRARER